MNRKYTYMVELERRNDWWRLDGTPAPSCCVFVRARSIHSARDVFWVPLGELMPFWKVLSIRRARKPSGLGYVRHAREVAS